MASQRADAINTANIATQSTNLGEMLLNNYENDPTGEGYVFNGNVFWELIRQISNGTVNDQSGLSSLGATAKTSKDFRAYNKLGDIERDVVVTIGGKQWIATYLSQNTTTHEPILTLWLASSSLKACQNEITKSSNGNFPSNMYGTSKMRAITLNNGGSYAVNYNDPSLTPVTQNTGSEWAIYTMTKAQNVNGSLTQFIEVPNNMSWQHSQNAKDYVKSTTYTQSYNYNNNNDALDSGGNGKIGSYSGKTGYKNWGTDRLWIPSAAETGINGEEGLWKASNNTRANSGGDCWLRSTFNELYSHYMGLGGRGSDLFVNDAKLSYAVRPAFHINLAKVEEYAVNILDVPNKIGSTYNGEEQDYFNADDANDWYNETSFSADKANVKAEYAPTAGSALSTTKPIEYGTYTVSLTIQGEKYIWSNYGTEKEVEFTINKRQLNVNLNSSTSPPTATPTNLCSRDSALSSGILKIRYTTDGYDAYVPPTTTDVYKAQVEIDDSLVIGQAKSSNYVLAKDYHVKYIAKPTILNTGNVPTYNGTQQQYFVVFGDPTDANEIDITVPNEFNGIVDYSAGKILVTQAGEYWLNLDLIEKDGTVKWSTRDTAQKTLEFNINEASMSIDIKANGSANIEVDKGNKVKVSIDSMQKVCSGDTINLDIKVVMTALTSYTETVYSNLSIDHNTTFPFEIEMETQGLAATEWKLELVPSGSNNANANYDIDLGNKPVILTVNSAGAENSLRWTFTRDGKEVGIYNQSTADLTDERIAPIEYNGKEITLTAKANDYTVDTTYSDEAGFVGGYKNAGGTDADTYITKVAMLKNGSNTPTVFTLTWTISKAKFDLTDVKWAKDGKLQYTSDTVYAVLENIPQGLIATYTNNDGKDVGNNSTATVTFELANDYKLNYEKPAQGGKDVNYTFNGSSDFEWTKKWEVVKAEISLEWAPTSHTDDDGNTYDIQILTDPLAKDLVEYVYFETDSNGNVLQGTTPIELKDIEYSTTARKWYKAYPKLNDTVNYAFSDGKTGDDLYSPFFAVGGGSTSVTVTLASNKIEYNGKPREVKLNISSGATLKDLTLTYYSGDLEDAAKKLDGAPTERGNYLVVITSNKNSVVLSGTTQYTFEIIAATISKNWNKNAKPYVLHLKYGQIDGIKYEMVDSQGNPVAFGDLAAGNKYQIKASIKDGMRDNYSFTDGTYETGWEEFELRPEDMANLQDPNDPKNTHYPQSEDDDPTNPDNPPSGDDNKGGIGSIEDLLEMLKDIPLWQIISGIISIILIIIFLSKTAGYESRRKEAKRLTKDKYKTYYAGAFLGLAISGWTAIACVLIALAVASFAIMLIAKSRCRKAEREKEYAKDEYEKNEARQRDENMRMMFMGMMGGNAGNNGNMGQGMPQGAYMGGGYGIGVEEMRLMINDAVAGLLPNMQQALPQQASTNDELVNRLLEQNEMLMHKLEEQQPVERIVEKEVVATSANDEAIKSLIEGQRIIMEKLSQQQSVEPQVVEKIVEKVVEVPVEVEKIVEKEVKVEVPVEVEKIVEKEVKVEVPVEKIVEKEVVKEVKVEVPVAVSAPAKPKKEVAPRLTLDEAYALLSKQQQKYFDGLRQYALSKPNAKEKKATYAITIGQSTVNPLLKLTIKKDMT
ncbi:MAG: hypothetical protein K2I23_02800, partial [Clostridia bacterium]|nr:hypothetical protein [Clostridia bacterium]